MVEIIGVHSSLKLIDIESEVTLIYELTKTHKSVHVMEPKMIKLLRGSY